MYSLSRITGVLSTLTSVLGIIFYFVNPVVTIYCAVFTLIDSIMQIRYGGQNNFCTEALEIIIGSAIALIAKLNYWYTVSFVICIGTLLLWFIGIISMMIATHSYYKH